MALDDLTTDLPHMLTVKETAAFLRISTPTVWRLLQEGELPRTRIGGKTFVQRGALKQFLESNTMNAA